MTRRRVNEIQAKNHFLSLFAPRIAFAPKNSAKANNLPGMISP
jgi:hypothetical protein